MKKQFSLNYFLTLLLCVQFAFAPISIAYADGNGSVVTIQETDKNERHEEETFIWSALLMFTMPAVGYYSWTHTPRGCYSPVVFSATAAYYGVMEAINWSDYKGGSAKALKILQGKDKDLQLQDLEAAKEETKRAREGIEQKITNVRAAMVGFGVASAWALYEWWAGQTPNSPMAACAYGLLDIQQSTKKNYYADNGSIKTDSIFSMTPNVGRNSNRLRLSHNKSFSFNTMSYQELSNSIEIITMISLLEKLSKMLIPSANAAMTTGEQWGLTGGVIAALFGDVLAEQLGLEKALQTALMRSGFYAAAAGIAYTAANEMEDVVSDLKTREQQYNSLIKALSQTNKVSSMDMQGSIKNNNVEQAPVIQDPLKAENDGNDDLCVTGGAAQAKAISCKRCNATNTCKKSEIPSGMQFPATMPRELAQATNLLQKAQNATYSGNTAQATLANTKLGQYASKIRKINKQLEDMINKDRISSGKKPVSFERMRKSLLKRYKKAAVAAINSLPTNKRTALLDRAGMKKSTNDKDNNTKLASKKVGQSALASAGGSGAKEEKKDPFAGLDFSLDEEAQEEVAKPVLGANEEYNYGEKREDIVQKKDTNIFQVITVRYLKSAYPVLLEEIE